MRVRDIMTDEVCCCTPQTSIIEAGRLMRKYQCGSLPVLEATNGNRLIGIVTDRDLVCRGLALAADDEIHITVGDCMSAPAISATPEMTVDECCQLMKENSIRRLPVVGDHGSCCGLISLGDVVREAGTRRTTSVVESVSRAV